MRIDSVLWGQVFGPVLSNGFTKWCDKKHVENAEKCPFPCLWDAISVWNRADAADEWSQGLLIGHEDRFRAVGSGLWSCVVEWLHKMMWHEACRKYWKMPFPMPVGFNISLKRGWCRWWMIPGPSYNSWGSIWSDSVRRFGLWSIFFRANGVIRDRWKMMKNTPFLIWEVLHHSEMRLIPLTIASGAFL